MQALRIYFAFLLLLFTLPLFGQNPLLGTWQRQTDSTWSTKIITPSHWMVFTENIAGEKRQFAHAQGGTYTQDGKNYIERFTVASWDITDREVTGFTFKVEGNTFYQEGIFIMGNASIIPINEEWHKVTTAPSHPDNPAIGTWNRLSVSVTRDEGTPESATHETAPCFELITPTHWIRLSRRDGKFESVMGGSYTMEGQKVYPKTEFASFPIPQEEKMGITQKILFDRRYTSGMITGPDGKRISAFEEVFQRAAKKQSQK